MLATNCYLETARQRLGKRRCQQDPDLLLCSDSHLHGPRLHAGIQRTASVPGALSRGARGLLWRVPVALA